MIPGAVESRKRAFLVSHRNRRKIQNTNFFRMRSFLTYLSERCKWASKGTGAVCGWVSLIVGATLAVLLWFYPRWFHDHISDRMNACVLVMVPLFAGASVFLVRWFVSPYAMYMQVRSTLDTLLISIQKRARIMLTLPTAGDKTTAILCHLTMLILYR